jgi:zinc transport system permease protein
MVFVTATLSQAAALGVALALYVDIHHQLALPPVLGAIVLSLTAAAILAIRPGRLRVSHEALLGMTYVVSAALVVLVGDHIAEEAHDIGAILFGTAVLVRPVDLWLVLGVGGATLLVHLWLLRSFVFSGFDPEGARVQGLPVPVLEVLLWTTIALVVSVATRALGALPVFAFAVLPAMTGLALASRVGVALGIAAVVGAISGGAGYILAFFLSFPVGASQAAVAAGIFVLVAPIARIRR